EEEAWAAAWQAGHSPAAPLIAIQPGSGGAAKLWPARAWAQVAEALAPAGTIVLTGGPDDAAEVAAISAALRAEHQTLVGSAGLGGLAALFGRCRLVLGVDNGPLHLAVSQGAPTVQIFGPGDAGRFGPWGDPERHRVLTAGLWCSPCGVLSHCPRQTEPSECMAAVAPAAVIRAASDLLGRFPAPSPPH
ncbi:MAG TPA: glycosyltransferase family 9 protein, partial [Herpetosiphonaceae bacterium]